VRISDMRNRKLSTLVLICALLGSGMIDGCQDETPVHPVDRPILSSHSVSDTCISNGTAPDEDLEIVVEGFTVTVIHRNARFNCCLDSIGIDLSVENCLLKITETEFVQRPCDCDCTFEVRASITVHEPALYIIEILFKGLVIAGRNVRVG